MRSTGFIEENIEAQGAGLVLMQDVQQCSVTVPRKRPTVCLKGQVVDIDGSHPVELLGWLEDVVSKQEPEIVKRGLLILVHVCPRQADDECADDQAD